MEPTNEEVRCAIVADLHNAKQALRNFQINVKRMRPDFVDMEAQRAVVLGYHMNDKGKRLTREDTLAVHKFALLGAVEDFEQELAAFDAQHDTISTGVWNANKIGTNKS